VSATTLEALTRGCTEPTGDAQPKTTSRYKREELIFMECHEEVVRRNQIDVCGRVGVAYRKDPEDLHPYPVCSKHCRGNMVPLSNEIQPVVEWGVRLMPSRYDTLHMSEDSAREEVAFWANPDGGVPSRTEFPRVLISRLAATSWEVQK
jgi:hypothetical protein